MEISSSFFDEIIDRRATGALKWTRYGEDILPLWVADSDFKCAPAIIEGLQERVAHGVLGYQIPAENEVVNQAVVNWLARRHNWKIKPEWIVWVPGVVTAFNGACRAFCEPGDKVLVQTPNYRPLLIAPELNDLHCVTVGTTLESGRWTLNLDELEEKASDPRTRLFILCNPMNPCGSVLTEQELRNIEMICLKYDVLLCSDEIHCDLLLDEKARHIPAGTLPDIGQKSITLMAASKTFNIAGLGASFAIIPDAKVREKYTKTTIGMQLWVNILGMTATEKAFTNCDDWYDAQLDYLRGNRDYLVQAFNRLDEFDYVPAQATNLAWIDASGLGVADVQHYMLSKGLAPSPGSDFGWPDFTRINFACPRVYLKQAIEKLNL